MTRGIVSSWLGVLLVAAGAGCGRPSGQSLTVAGSTAFQPFAEKLAEQFTTGRAGVTINVQGGGSALGIQSTRSGAAHIGMADLVELPPEARELISVVVARDGIALVVHPDNPVGNLTTDQVRGIFAGTLRNWKDVGGKDQTIRVVSREAGSGTRSSFEQILGGIRLAPDALVQDSNGTIRETVANDGSAIGYLSHGLLNEKVRAVPVDGVGCTEADIVAGRYRLVRPVFLLTKGEAAGMTKEFLDYVLSAEGQATIRQNGLLPAK